MIPRRERYEKGSVKRKGVKRSRRTKSWLKKKLTFQFQSKDTAVLDALKTWDGDWDSQTVHNDSYSQK